MFGLMIQLIPLECIRKDGLYYVQEDNILITVIIPAYRVERYIEKCVDSLLGIPVNKEIFIVVDSWDDPTVQACRKYIGPNSDIEIILNDDKGISEARNTGLRIAKGKYIWFVDADDYICECHNALIWNKLQEYSPEIMMFDAGVVNETDWDWDENNYIRRDKIKQITAFSGIEFFQRYYLEDAYRVTAWLNIFSREFLKHRKLLFLKNYAHEDEDFTFRAIIYAKDIIYCDEKLYMRRYRLNSAMTGGFHEKQIDDFFKILQKNTQFIQNICDVSFQKIYSRYLYDRINLLIDRINVSDIADKAKWYRIAAEYFYEYITKYSKKDLSKLLMMVEVVFHAKAVVQSSDDKLILGKRLEEQLLVCWQEGVRDKIKNCMRNGKGSCLGIYGTGKHTQWLLPVYLDIADEERMRLLFIDSKKESHTEYFEGYEIVNIRDIDIGTTIVISSFFSQDEIYETIRMLNSPCTIIKIYE